MPFRGIYNFEVNEEGNLIYSNYNVELLRKLWLDCEIIKPEGPGPGDPGDFNYGAWHISCHLLAAGCVRKTFDEKLIWLEISYDFDKGIYFPSLTIQENGIINTYNIKSSNAENILKSSVLLGFVEGTSEGRVSAKDIVDDINLFNGSLRQEYDQNPGSSTEGGRVWEHWCSARDIRITSKIGSSVLDSYIALVSVSGDKFVPIVARGRVDYKHPSQLGALIKAGFTSIESANLKIKPTHIPEDINILLQEATPDSSYLAIEKLDWKNPLKYYMFQRSIGNWNNKTIL